VHALDDKPIERPKQPRGEIIDLMPLLRKSVEEAKGPRALKPRKKAARRRSA
jgi:non-homologous end joining protein Ku